MEAYTLNCANQSIDQSDYLGKEGSEGGTVRGMPEVPSFPDADGYKLLKGSLLEELWDFPQRCHNASEVAESYLQMEGNTYGYNQTVI